jgi:hypothetical protein
MSVMLGTTLKSMRVQKVTCLHYCACDCLLFLSCVRVELLQMKAALGDKIIVIVQL